MKKTIMRTGVILSMFFIISCSGTRPSTLGIKDGKLAGCPDKPNCVSSQADDPDHLIEPIPYTIEKSAAIKALKKAISTQERILIVQETPEYLYAEFKTKIMGFVDDVEFYFPETEPLIHVRSASRLGYSDLGVNRKRIEKIKALFITEAQK